MNTKKQILASLNDEISRWEKFLNGLTEAQINTPNVFGIWSTKDVVGHLTGWQQLSAARLKAALENKQPDYPELFAKPDPDDEEMLESTNAAIYQYYRRLPWPTVLQEWRERFQQILALTESLSENDLFGQGRYSWLGSNILADVLLGTIDHHNEHYEPLMSIFC